MEHYILEGVIVEDENGVSLAELCKVCQADAEWVMALVQEGILDPMEMASKRWRFSGISLRRALVVRRLQQDLGINLAGAAVVLELLEEREVMRAKLET